MDPIKQITEPTAEVRKHASHFVDEYGETWMVIDGIETKVPSIQAAHAILDHNDRLRELIRSDLDAQGIRDRTEKVKITLDDGTETEVDMLPMGDAGANILQIGKFPDAEGLQREAERADFEREVKEKAAAIARGIDERRTESTAKRVMRRFRRALKALARK